MPKTSSRILFFGNERLGTGVATTAPTLQALTAAGYDVAAVIVAQDDIGRSRHQRELEITQVAALHHIPVLSPAKLGEAKDELQAFGAQAAVLVAYGKIVPQSIIDLFPSGIINIHPSLLPKHRGPTPIESVILGGDKETGVSLMCLSAKMDAGPIYAHETVPLSGSETKPALAEQLLGVGKDMLLSYLPQILDGLLKPTEQDNDQATYDKLLRKADSQLDFTKPAEQLEREIRAYAGWPRSRTTLFAKDVIITQAHAVPVNNPDVKPGSVETLKEGVLMIQCNTGYLCIDKLIPSGKKEMSAAAFLAGYDPTPHKK